MGEPASGPTTSVPDTLTVRVELFGMARVLSGSRHVDLPLPTEATHDAVAAALGRKCPELLGHVISDDGLQFLQSYTLNLNGQLFVGDQPLHLKLGDSLLLFSSQAGG